METAERAVNGRRDGCAAPANRIAPGGTGSCPEKASAIAGLHYDMSAGEPAAFT